MAFPEIEGTARAMIIAAHTEGKLRAVEALDLENDSASWRQSFADNDLLEAIVYEDALSGLNIQPGPLTPGPADSRRGLPASTDNFELRLTASGPTTEGWVERASRSAALEAFRLPEDGTECPRLVATNHELPGGENGIFARRLPSGQVLLGDAAGRVWMTNGPELQTITRGDGGTFTLTSAAVAPDTEELFFGTGGGQIHRGTLTGNVLDVSFVTVTAASGYLRFLDVVAATPTLELYTMSTFGELFHYAGGEWTLLHDFGRSGGFAGLQGFTRVEGTNGREILAVVAEDNRVASIRDGVVEMQTTPSASGLISINLVEGLGPVAGNDLGQLFGRIDGTWQSLGPTGISLWLTVVTSVEPGLFIFASAFGSVGSFRGGVSCGASQLLPADPFWVVPVGPTAERRFIAFGDRTSADDAWYSELRLD